MHSEYILEVLEPDALVQPVVAAVEEIGGNTSAAEKLGGCSKSPAKLVLAVASATLNAVAAAPRGNSPIAVT